MEYAELRHLADIAVRAGTLPSDPAVPFLPTLNVSLDVACSLCGELFGPAPVFRLIDADVILLHGQCFSAWIDVVVTPTRGE